MVGGNAMTRRGKPRYRKRHPAPAIALVVMLLAVAVAVWLMVLHKSEDVNARLACPPPSPPTSTAGQPPGTPAPALGQVLDRTALDRTAPVPAAEVQLRVLNGAEQRRHAAIVSGALEDLGFTAIGKPDDDPVYPNRDMTCPGQIRFGPNGAGAARTISLVVPCTELIRDERQDASVDLVIGHGFDRISPNPEAKQVLANLADFAETHPRSQGGQQAQGQLAVLDPQLLTGARDVQC